MADDPTPVALPLDLALTGRFYKRAKSGKFKPLDDPVLESAIADTHAHLGQLPEPALALARAGAHDVHFLGSVIDIVEERLATYDALGTWEKAAAVLIRPMGKGRVCGAPAPHPPKVRLIVGCHPHNAARFDDAARERLREAVRDPRVAAIGEVGLDYHYDLSPQDVQRAVFEEQLGFAAEHDLPVMLHIREAHDDALDILNAVGWPAAGVILHCYTLGPEALEPWLAAGASVAFGGALTFGRSDDVREAAAIVPTDRLLTETDAPYMAPHPLRGQRCEPAMVALTAERLAEVRGAGVGMPRRDLLDACMANARALLDRPALAYQDTEAPRGDMRAAQALVERIRAAAGVASAADEARAAGVARAVDAASAGDAANAANARDAADADGGAREEGTSCNG